MPVSYIVSDETLLNWLFEAMNYESFLNTRSLYEKELIYYRALDYQSNMYGKYIQRLPSSSETTADEWKDITARFQKMSSETRVDDAQRLVKLLRPIVGYEATKNRADSISLSLLNSNEQIKLTHPQIAILYHVCGQLITKNNKDDIAHKYGQTSGQKLLDTFCQLDDESVRTGPGRYTVKNYEKIIPLLTGAAKVLAEKELAEAKKKNKNS